ncbi:MAG: type II toxin-antitoxin system VapC family toxin [Planctomycetes bacterium]|nr:type II toxin-antitoxin system VapC family toxin [Planctomycetota bacterium]
MLIAYLHKRDQYHRRARRILKLLIRRRTRLLLPHAVMGEVTTYFKRFSLEGCRTAVSSLESLLAAGVFEAAPPEADETASALRGILELQDPGFTFVDALLVAMARQRGIAKILSFDGAFELLGFVMPR